MKSLKQYLKEMRAVPSNTMGMGNPMAPTDTEVGSGDILCFIPKKKKKIKSRIQKER